MAAGTLEKADNSAAGSSCGSNSGRARVPARREQVYVINLDKRWIWSVLGFGKTDREDPTSPNAPEENATPQKGYVGQAAIPPGHQSACVTTTKNEAPCEHLQPATRVQFAASAILHHPNPNPTFRARGRAQLVRRSQRSIMHATQGRPRKRGALHNRAQAEAEARGRF
jgi:hypothetical protein